MRGLNLLKQIALMIGMVFLLSACGDDNEVNSTEAVAQTTTNGNGSGSNTVTTGSADSVSSVVAGVKSLVGNCSTGTRLQDVHYQTSSAAFVSGTTLYGQFAATSASSGSVEEYYAGVSNFGDIMVVSKMENMDVYNVTVAYCPYRSTLYTNRTLRDLLPYNGLILSNQPASLNEFGDITAMDVYVQMDAYENLPAGEFGPTTFNAL